MRYIFFILLLTSCGLKQAVVPNIDMAIEHKLRKDMRLTYKQQKRLSKDVDLVLNNIAPHTNEYLIPLIKEIDINEINKVNEKKVIKQVNTLFFKITEEFTSLMAKYLSELTARQFKHFISTYESQNKDIQKRIKKYNTNLLIQRFEFFIGNLNQKQIETINNFKPELIERNKKRLQIRVSFKNSILTIFNTYKDQKVKYKAILEAYSKQNTSTSEYFKSKATKKVYKMILKVISQSDKAQKRRLQAKIDTAKEWIAYFINHDF